MVGEKVNELFNERPIKKLNLFDERNNLVKY